MTRRTFVAALAALAAAPKAALAALRPRRVTRNLIREKLWFYKSRPISPEPSLTLQAFSDALKRSGYLESQRRMFETEVAWAKALKQRPSDGGGRGLEIRL